MGAIFAQSGHHGAIPRFFALLPSQKAFFGLQVFFSNFLWRFDGKWQTFDRRSLFGSHTMIEGLDQDFSATISVLFITVVLYLGIPRHRHSHIHCM
jgi:hypothetical protein